VEKLNLKSKDLMIEKSKKYKKNNVSSVIVTNVLRLLMVFWSITVLFPLLWTLYSSLKNNKAFYANPWALPKVLHFENYYNAWITSNFGRYFFNSLIVVLSALILNLLVTSMAAYVLSKFKFFGSRFLLIFFLAGTMVPSMVTLGPLFFFSQSLHLTGKLSGLVIVYVFTNIPFSIFLIYGFMKRIPGAFSEAAMMDGCSDYGIFFRIILPLAKPGLVIAGILNVLNFWNEYIVALVFISDPIKFTVPVGISMLSGTMEYRTDFGALFAGLIIGMIPMIIVYTLFQRQLQDGMAIGSGVKG
jgi:N-acetylglucosamine transport system permease protein